jgi:DNA-binding transcriptional regulator YiaG
MPWRCTAVALSANSRDACLKRVVMNFVQRWTGRETAALRSALRLSMRDFADHLGVALRTVAKWEHGQTATIPRPDTQAILDTALARADPTVRERFHQLVRGSSGGVDGADYESWEEDIERAVVYLGGQRLSPALRMLNRWLNERDPRSLDERGRYLYGRCLTLLGDLYRDQGATHGPLSAHRSYIAARRLLVELDIPRRVAQVDLSLAVIEEMSGSVQQAARNYEALAADERLRERDRARARLWMGTALTKAGESPYAVEVMADAARAFEDLEEPEDWSVSQQKIALAYRGMGELDEAQRCIGIARTTGPYGTPMQRVRLDTAHGHILLTDPATQSEGIDVLAGAQITASRYGLHHQVRSIEAVRCSVET